MTISLLRAGLPLPRVSALLTNLVEHWRLNEATGNRLGAHAGQTLFENGPATPSVAGVIGDAVDLESSSSQYFLATGTPFATGNVDYTIGVWLYLESKPGNDMFVVCKSNLAFGQEYELVWKTTADRFEFRAYTAPGTRTVVQSTTFGAPALATWYYVLAWHASSGSVNISVNNGGTDTVAMAAQQAAGTENFGFGALPLTPNQFWDGRIDSCSFWLRLLLAGERTSLYNAGAGLDYPF